MERITVRLRAMERRILEEAAYRHGETTSGFARSAALEAARRVLGERDRPIRRERQPEECVL